MESWLGDMARQGLFLEPEGIAWGLARFQRGEPREVEYRLVSRRKPRKLWKLFLCGDPERFEGPKEEEVNLFAQFGWVYLSKCGNFFVYQAEGEGPCEVDSDPRVQAISIQAVRDLEGVSILNMLLILGLNVVLHLSGSLFYMIAEGVLGYYLGILLLPLWLAGLFFLRVLYLDKLRRKLERGVPLDHKKPWRQRSGLHYVKITMNILIGLAFVGLYGYVLSGDVYRPAAVHYELLDYPQDPPFATVEDLAPEGEYRLNWDHFSNGVTECSSNLVPVTICWNEKADVTLGDGSVYTAALCLEYYETAFPWLARGIAGDLHRQDRELDRQANGYYEVLELSDLDADYACAYLDPWNIPALVIQKGTTVLHASLEQTGDCQLSLEEWTTQMVESIQS